MISLLVEYKKVDLIGVENRKMVTKCWREKEEKERWIDKY
jgi:hypothetical protein